MIEIKPCPFCDGKPQISRSNPTVDNSYNIWINWEISCKCGIKLYENSKYSINSDEELVIRLGGRKKLIEKWNNRNSDK